MQYFNNLTTSLYLVDFILTGFLMANHKIFKKGIDDDEFMMNSTLFGLIAFFQTLDIGLHFFKTRYHNERGIETKIDDPWEVTIGYIKSFFLIDLIATFPYSHVRPQLIYLRFVKLAKI